MKNLLLFLLIFYAFPFSSLAQNKITGKITDTDHKPLPGVNVVVKGTTQGTITDLDGNYSINASESDSLTFSMVGMKSQTIPVGTRKVINVTLAQEVTELDQLVVIGYGTVKKSDLTGAVSTVKGEDITNYTSSSPQQGLQGKVSGVQITSTSGAPGAVPVVRIRGVGTFNNSSPIYVVDGVILDDISFLNAADIQNVQVLKDASATAIYGSRGANGVILITTKKGKIGNGKATFTYNGEYSIQHLTKKIDLLSGPEFATIANEIVPGSYNNIDLVPNTDWQDLIFHNAPMQSHQFSASGGTERIQYYLSVGYFGQPGIIDKSDYQRISIKINNTYKLLKNITLGNNISLSPFKEQVAPNVTYSVYRAQPVLVPYYPDGSFAVVYNVGNPLADLKYSNNFNKGIRGVGDVYARATLFRAFTLKTSYGIDAFYKKSVNFTPAFTVYNPDGSASQQQNVLNDLYKADEDNMTWLWENTLTFNKTYGKHELNAVGGFTMQNTTSEKLELTGENILRDSKDFWYISPNSILDASNNVNQVASISNTVDPNLYYSMISYLFRANYAYAGKYIFTVTFRRDGSSKFSAQNRYSNFPSLAAGWNIGKEKFMKKFFMISHLKIRGSWGIIGNDKIPYNNRYARVESGLVTIFGASPAANAAASYGKNGNPDLKWESTKQADLGLEIGIFNNKLSGEFDYYHRVTDDILIDLSTPGYLGNGQGQKITFNAGSVLNTGLDAKIIWKGQAGKFGYNISVLGSTVHNEVLKVGGNSGVDSVLVGGYLGNGIPVTQSRVGKPIGAFYGYKTDGVFQNQAELNAYPHDAMAQPGDLRFVDVNGDGKIDGNDRTYIGSPIPKFIFGFNVDLIYEGFDLSIDLQGQTGNKIFNGKEVVRPDPYNFEQHVMNRWTGPGTSNTEPRPSFGGYNYSPSDRFIQNGSFLRLRNVMLGYTIPSGITGKIGIQKLRIYVKGSNLFTLTKFTGYTPEIGSTDVLSNGIDNGTYPIPAVYSAGINLTF